MGQGLIRLSPVLKLTESCNLNCSYCYQAHRLKAGQSMSAATLEHILQQLGETCQLPMNILWYGGEPSLIGLESFKVAVSRAEAVLGADNLRHSLQTNGVLINDAWAGYLAEHGFSVRVSLDGPPRLHDLQRPNHGGQGSQAQAVRGLQALVRAGVQPKVACVVTPASLSCAHELLDYFEALGVEELDFSPALRVVDGKIDVWVGGVSYGNFLLEALRHWLSRPDSGLRIRTLAGLIRKLSGQSTGFCKLEGSCSRYLTFAWNGDVYPCDEFSGFDDYRLGNVLTTPLPSIIAGERALRIQNDWAQPAPHCQACLWQGLCPGALCPFERMMNGGLDQGSVLCPSWRHLLEQLAPQL